MGTLTRNPRVDSECAAASTGLKAMRKIRGERLFTWKTPLEIGKLEVDQSLVITYAVSCEYVLFM